ncbi:MAG: hypothetical protein PF637_03765 [Spirochaetes bacterium]|jgi:hypothetical protein|nr:hypothetical protein [Spirochaetota bacterium]
MNETTITMEYNRYKKLLFFCEQANISKSKFIILCLNKYIPKLKKNRYRFSNRQYQKRAPKWETVHLYLHPVKKEKYENIACLNKYTLSLLVALALDNYAEAIIEELANKEINDDNGVFTEFFSVFYGYTDGKMILNFLWDKSLDENSITIYQTVTNRNLILTI